jgi:radical SAM superfamily enzyme YgiQ (UPF0313 family)
VKVLLLSLNRIKFPFPVYPLGLDHVAGAISPPHEVRIVDVCGVPDDRVLPEIEEGIRAFEPDAVGLTIRNVDNNDATAVEAFLAPSRAAVERIRATTRAPLVLGGSGFTVFPTELMAALDADYGVVGEGEQARALFDALEAGRAPADLPGIAVRGQPAPRAVPLQGRLPRRAAPGLNPRTPFYLSRGGMLNLQTQRGCPYRCVYCSYPNIEGRKFRREEDDEVARVALELQDAGARHLFITDSVFNGDPRHADAIAEAFVRAGLRTPWTAFFTPTKPSDGFYDRMQAAGCSHVEFGTESLSDVMLRRLRKSFKPAAVFAAHAAARAAGLHVAHFLLLGGPGETAETLDETLDAAEQLDDAALFFFCGMRIYPDTEIAQIALKDGQLAPGQNLLAPVFYEAPGLPLDRIAKRVEERAAGRVSWIVGSGAARAEALIARLHARGHSGPLWERLVA